MTSQRQIVVGVALVDSLDPVLPTAARLSTAMGARLHVVHVLESRSEIAGSGDARTATALADRIEEVRSVLLTQCERLGCGGAVEIHVVAGSPHDEVVRAANDTGAELLVIGATGNAGSWRTILGTTAERILARTRVAVLVIHQPFFRAVEKVLVATDLAFPSEDLFERGLDVVERLFGTSARERRAIFVRTALSMAATTPLLDGEAAVKADLDHFLEARRPRACGIAGRVRFGRPSVEINVEADSWGADLIVMGTHGRTGVARYAFGSVAASTIRDSTRNVLVIPTTRAGSTADGALSLSAVENM